ncbi:uracil-DNA glycosylase [Salimicrobium jeotgali]|uniref:Uracil-DNA glycosylase n=2 Tax=Salimicrobium TaxID=351195 RepID=K2GCD6_9BACI|nr:MULTISPECIES: uracil-DNA glycosylase [Salimicrobium]AKG04444.1 uracil-DNA glycosylase [Salimicrobium jeotgali]EKE32648.1 uracil-DNA glycosylase [Salimicrobium jeotgali]MBM7695369.1 uracil-DNA glycosylase [Salimicrobium jeotgali]PBB05419.1 uracil-DNA glycosylase [Salimicrobium humidisoli]
MIDLNNDWNPLLQPEQDKTYYRQLRSFLKEEYGTKEIYPPMHDIFNALQTTGYEDTKVVILGQDPYHGPGQAHGYSFSVRPGVTIPPSLRNIFKELEEDVGVPAPSGGSLLPWAEEGVLLMNNVLTVRRGEAHSHQGKGWEQFTDKVIEVLNERETPVVFFLWGRAARQKADGVDRDKHFVIESSHPSPFAAHKGFFGSRPFSRANAFLEEKGRSPVNWELP